MEDSRQGVAIAALVARILSAVVLLGGVLVGMRAARAESLDQRIPHLFGGTLATSIDRNDPGPDVQQVPIAARFRGLSAALAAARSQAPVPSATGALRFEWDDDLEVYVRSLESLGPLIAERAQTLGRRTITLSMAYTRVDFDTLEGDRLDRLHATQPALSPGFLSNPSLPESDKARARDNQLITQLDLGFGFDLFFLTAAYGVTDTIDVSMALSINQVRMHGTASAIITDPHGDGGAFFTVKQPGAIQGGSGPLCETDFTCATDHFDDSKVGTGDLFLRGKWHFYDTEFIDFAAAGILTLPTGNANDFLGFHDPTFTPWLIMSKTFGRVSPHINLGYSFRSSADVSQAQWIAGADVKTFDWLTLASDFLGFHDDNRDGINDDVFQSAVGFKVNPLGNLILGASFQFPLNRDGLRADVIYTGQVEYTFY